MQRAPRFHRRSRHSSSKRTKACANCKQHPAKFSYNGRVRADRDHTLCFRCFRRERDRLQARIMATPKRVM